MTEISDLTNSFYSSDCDTSSNKDDDIDIKNYYSIRCQECYSSAIIQKADFINNIFTIKCKNNHVYDYKSYKDFIDNTNKNLYQLLCYNCKQNENLVKCESCNIFLCKECKANHKHSTFVELNNIDKKFNNYNLSDNLNNSSLNITDMNKEYQKIIDNIQIVKNIKKQYDQWLNELSNCINKYINCILNYFGTQQIIINYLKKNINYFSFYNYQLFNKNYNLINNFIDKINITINSEQTKEGIEKKSILFLDVLKMIDNQKYFSFINNNDEKIEILKSNEIIQNTNLINVIGDMKKIKLRYKSEINNEITTTNIKCFSSFKNKQYIILGNKAGEINIFKLTSNKNLLIENEKYKLQFKLKVFDNEVKYICEINDNLFVVTDGKYEIKIIQYNDINKYSVIQTIFIDNFIYSMISLPFLSSKNKYHYFCFSDDRNIYIYKSNISKKNSDNDLFFFDIFKIIELDTLTHSLIEINENYLVSACTDIQTIKFFDMNNDFKEIKELDNINSTRGTNIFTLVPNKKLLVVACTDGFKFISTIKLKKYKSVHCRYSVLCVELFNENSIICSCFDNKKYKIKQYKIKEKTYELEKISERIFQNNDEIWKLQKINERIFFIDGQNEINFLSLIF